MAREEREVRYTVPVNHELDARVRRRIETGGFSTVAEYVRGLMRADVEEAAQRRLEERLLERLESGDAGALTAGVWERQRARGRSVRMGPTGRVRKESSEERLERVLAALRTHQKELREKGVLHAAVFGSTARGEATSTSDVDVAVVLDPKRSLGVFEFVGITHLIQELVPGADVVERRALKPRVRARVDEEAIDAF